MERKQVHWCLASICAFDVPVTRWFCNQLWTLSCAASFSFPDFICSHSIRKLVAGTCPVPARTSKGIRFFSKLVSELWPHPFGLERVNILFTSNTQHYTTLQLCPGGVQLKTLLLKKLLNTRTPTMHISNSSCHIVKKVAKRERVAGSR